MNEKQREYATGEVAKLDEWARGAIVGYLAGFASPFLLWWTISGPLK